MAKKYYLVDASYVEGLEKIAAGNASRPFAPRSDRYAAAIVAEIVNELKSSRIIIQ